MFRVYENFCRKGGVSCSDVDGIRYRYLSDTFFGIAASTGDGQSVFVSVSNMVTVP